MKFLLIQTTSLLFYFVPLQSSGQRNDWVKKNISKVLYQGSYFDFYLSPYISQKAETLKQSGSYPLNASKSSGLEAGGNYFINFNKIYSIIVVAHVGYSGRNFKLFISKSDFDPNLKNNINFNGPLSKDFDLYMSVPVWIEKRWITKNNTAWNLDAGINIRFDPNPAIYSYDFGGFDIKGNYVPVLNMQGPAGNNEKPWLNYNIAAGYSLFLSNYNFIRINLIGNFSTTKVINFNYTINVTGKDETTGSYSTNLSYIGLSISYILTGTNKRLLLHYQQLSSNDKAK
jgi:hypothetical protein